ncbi:MAG: hypothetical protein JW993_18790 [Sedimentisphaerales bacterium]|nr:hypothetical protein [Sedimentisphaerales bacterium]
MIAAYSVAPAGTTVRRPSLHPGRDRGTPVLRRPKLALPRLAGALAVYVAFVVYLYRPYFEGFQSWQWLLPTNVLLAAVGCFVVSRRWVAGFTGSLLAGAVYGFGPFMLGLARYHPTAGLLGACIPWLFAPAALWGRRRHALVGAALSLLPFLGVVLFFRVSALEDYRFFAAPIQSQPRPVDLVGFVAPLVVADRGAMLASLYHAPVAALVLGAAMMVKARRYGLLVMAALGLALALCKSYLGPAAVVWLGVSPILWLSIPMVCLAVLAGLGMQGLLDAGHADRKWILAVAICLGALAIVILLLAAKYFQVIFGLADGYAKLFVEAAKMYLMAALAVGIVFAIARQNLRLQPLRWAVLCAALGFDVFLGARYIVDKIL